MGAPTPGHALHVLRKMKYDQTNTLQPPTPSPTNGPARGVHVHLRQRTARGQRREWVCVASRRSLCSAGASPGSAGRAPLPAAVSTRTGLISQGRRHPQDTRAARLVSLAWFQRAPRAAVRQEAQPARKSLHRRIWAVASGAPCEVVGRPDRGKAQIRNSPDTQRLQETYKQGPPVGWLGPSGLLGIQPNSDGCGFPKEENSGNCMKSHQKFR